MFFSFLVFCFQGQKIFCQAISSEENYARNYPGIVMVQAVFSAQEYLPKEISGIKFYDPGKNAREEDLRKFLKSLWKDKYNY